MSGTPRQAHSYRNAALFVGGAIALAAAAAALSPSGSFLRTFLYVACTLAVCAAATVATIRVLARLFKDRTGIVEFGVLIGLFVVAPAALSGAFQILAALVGAP